MIPGRERLEAVRARAAGGTGPTARSLRSRGGRPRAAPRAPRRTRGRSRRSPRAARRTARPRRASASAPLLAGQTLQRLHGHGVGHAAAVQPRRGCREQHLRMRVQRANGVGTEERAIEALGRVEIAVREETGIRQPGVDPVEALAAERIQAGLLRQPVHLGEAEHVAAIAPPHGRIVLAQAHLLDRLEARRLGQDRSRRRPT